MGNFTWNIMNETRKHALSAMPQDLKSCFKINKKEEKEEKQMNEDKGGKRQMEKGGK